MSVHEAMTMGQWGLLFLEGIAAFISPCILPMLPVYLIYLAGDDGNRGVKTRILHSIGFVLGFTCVFVLLGMSATAIGRGLIRYQSVLRRVAGVILIVFGLHYMGVFRIGFLNREKRVKYQTKESNFLSSVIFGAVFSFGWTPCMGPLLGMAMFLAGNQNTLLQGALMLFVFSMGLGIPFLLTAFFYEKLTGVLGWLKRHHALIQRISGIIFIVVGLAFLFDVFSYYAALFN